MGVEAGADRSPVAAGFWRRTCSKPPLKSVADSRLADVPNSTGRLSVGAQAAPGAGLVRVARAGIERPAVDREEADLRVVPKHGLRAVAVMDVPIDDQDAVQAQVRATRQRAATATLLNRQKPIGASARAWCPGGRTRHRACVSSPRTTRSTASQTAPAASRATSNDRGLHTVSSSIRPPPRARTPRWPLCVPLDARPPVAARWRAARLAGGCGGPIPFAPTAARFAPGARAARDACRSGAREKTDRSTAVSWGYAASGVSKHRVGTT